MIDGGSRDGLSSWQSLKATGWHRPLYLHYMNPSLLLTLTLSLTIKEERGQRKHTIFLTVLARHFNPILYSPIIGANYSSRYSKWLEMKMGEGWKYSSWLQHVPRKKTVVHERSINLWLQLAIGIKHGYQITMDSSPSPRT